MHELLSAIGVSSIPPGQTEEALVKKALQDNFLFNKCLAALVEQAAPGVVRDLLQLERTKLRDRLVPPAPGKVPVYWEIIQPSRSTNGQMTILASHDKETMRWSGDWTKVRTLEFYGEKIPSEIAHIYELNFSTPRTDPEFAREQRIAEREALEAAMKRQENTGEAALANEAIARMNRM